MDTWSFWTPERLGTPSFSMDRAYEVPLYRTNAGYEIIDAPPGGVLPEARFLSKKMESFQTPSPELEKDLNSW